MLYHARKHKQRKSNTAVRAGIVVQCLCLKTNSCLCLSTNPWKQIFAAPRVWPRVCVKNSNKSMDIKYRLFIYIFSQIYCHRSIYISPENKRFFWNWTCCVSNKYVKIKKIKKTNQKPTSSNAVSVGRQRSSLMHWAVSEFFISVVFFVVLQCRVVSVTFWIAGWQISEVRIQQLEFLFQTYSFS